MLHYCLRHQSGYQKGLCTSSNAVCTGLWRQRYFNEALSSTSSFTASVFQMAGSQLIYLHVPGSAYGLRQQVVSNDMLQLPSVSEMSQTTVMECLQPVYLNIKSKMMVWAANVLLLCASKQQQCGILALPTEALTNTLSRLSYADVAVLASVSRRMKSVASERSVWECLLKQEFSQEAPADKVLRLFTLFMLDSSNLIIAST